MTHEELKALLAQADEHNNTGNYDEAEKLAQQVLNSIPLVPSEHPPFIEGEERSEGAIQREDAELHISSLISLSWTSFLKADYQQSCTIALSALDLARFYDFASLQAKALGYIANVHQNLSDYSLALNYYGKALALDEELGNKAGVARHLGNIGVAHMDLSDYPRALEYHGKALALDEELGNKAGVARHLGNIGNVHVYLSDYAKALEYMQKALALAEELGDKRNVGGVNVNIGLVYGGLGYYEKALEYYTKALAIFDEIGEKTFKANVTGNVGVVYGALGDKNKELEYYMQAVAMHTELGNRSGVASVTGNIGGVYANLGDYDKAFEYFAKALAVHEELGQKLLVARTTGNIGLVYAQLGDYDKALEYYNKSHASKEELGEKSGVAGVIGNIGCLYADKKIKFFDAAKAEEYFLKALALSEEIKAKAMLVNQHKFLADLYESEKRWEDFAVHFKKHIELRDEVQSEEAHKQASLMEQRKQVAERERQQTLEREKANATRELLDLVLPTSIATRMLAGEKCIADYFDRVSILFADMVGFTSLATEVPPDIVIDLLNYVFDVFDEIIKRNGCEKIKTIGDGYMAIAGAPEECSDHAERMARAALEMQNDISLPDDIRKHLPKGTKFGVRVGIHTGAAVCGVIGKERFVWDVYSDAVNIASRMESSGESGKVHVSREFAWLLRSRQRLSKGAEEFTLVERGEMDIKGKGMMKTYFLEKVNL